MLRYHAFPCPPASLKRAHTTWLTPHGSHHMPCLLCW
jgi:hypothetical protein